MAWQDFLRNNSTALTNAGVGLLSGRTGPEQFALGAQGFAQGRQDNKTKQWIAQNAPPEIAQAVQAGVITPADGFKMLSESRTKKAPLQINGKLVDPETYQVLADFSDKKIGADAVEYGLNPIYGTDANGNPVVLQTSKAGVIGQAQLPDGVKLSKEPIKMDVGTGYVLLDPITRQQIGMVPKDLAGAAAATAGGRVQGETQATAQVNLGGAKQSVDRIDMMINDLKNDPGLEKVLGPIDSRTPNLSADAVRAQSKIDQIGGQAFLEARQLLKGGGAITDFESARAEQAYVRLQQAQDPRDFRQALDEFNQAVKDGYAKLERQAMGAPMPSGATKRRVYNPATGMLE